MPARSRDRPPGPSAESRLLCVRPATRVGLVHELGKLRGTEELLQRRDDRPDVDQGLRRDRLDVLGGHPITDHALHAAEPGAQLVLDQLADRTQPPIAEVVDVVLFDDQLATRGIQGLRPSCSATTKRIAATMSSMVSTC